MAFLRKKKKKIISSLTVLSFSDWSGRGCVPTCLINLVSETDCKQFLTAPRRRASAPVSALGKRKLIVVFSVNTPVFGLINTITWWMWLEIKISYSWRKTWWRAMMKAAVTESKAINLQRRRLKAAYVPPAEEDTLTWQMGCLCASIYYYLFIFYLWLNRNESFIGWHKRRKKKALCLLTSLSQLKEN